MASTVERILILAKTYPSPSAQYMETSCIAGISETGAMRRLYPVPFRMIDDGQQFKKWQWVNVRIEKANTDHRPESHRIFVDTIECGNVLGTQKEWLARREWIGKIPTFDSFEEMEAARLQSGHSIALLRIETLDGLLIEKARNADWTDEEREKLTRAELQGNLFADSTAQADAAKRVRQLKKIPFDFYYRYRCESGAGDSHHVHKIVDWEAGALYWNCRGSHGERWQAPFRERLEGHMSGRNLMLLMGNQHRFQDQWLIISLIYPPQPQAPHASQAVLF